ncbi:hypothetical protein GEMRC1_013914 [Eukaryota sp. GEM-RC1]
MNSLTHILRLETTTTPSLFGSTSSTSAFGSFRPEIHSFGKEPTFGASSFGTQGTQQVTSSFVIPSTSAPFGQPQRPSTSLEALHLLLVKLHNSLRLPVCLVSLNSLHPLVCLVSRNNSLHPLSTSTGLFGQPQQQSTSTGLFGQPQQQSTSTGLFGQPQQQSTSTGLFGQPQQQSTSTGLFGQPQQQSTSTGLFGQPQQQSTSTGLFGQPQQQSTSTGLFGQPQQQSTSTGLFGQPQQQSTSTGLFGQPQQPQQPSTSLFGQPLDTTTTVQSSTFSFTSTSFCNKLHSFQKENLLTDIVIHYDDVPFHCHSFVVSSFSSDLRAKVFKSSSIEFPPLPFLSDPDLFFLVLSTFYGESLPITTKSAPILSLIASLLEFHELSDFVNDRMTKGLGNVDDNIFKIDTDVVVTKFVGSCSRDVRVSYQNTDIGMNSVILSLFSQFFFNSFTCKFADSDVKTFEYAEEFPGVSEEAFSLFFDLCHCKSIEFSISNVLDFFQLSVYFQVDDLKLACQEFLANNSFSEEDLVELLISCNERHQFNFLTENVEVFKNLSDISEEPCPLRVSFIVLLFPHIDMNWLFLCLMELHEAEGFSTAELASMLKSSTIPETSFSEIFEILEPLFDNTDFTSTLVEWSLEIFKNVEDFNNLPISWFLVVLLLVDRDLQFSDNLNYLCQIFSDVVPWDSLDSETYECFSTSCLELLCSKLPADYCIWLGESLVNSWKNSEEFNHSWTIDSFVKCVESISVDDKNKFEALNIFMELKDDDHLKFFINSYVARISLDVMASHGKELKVLKNLVELLVSETSDHMYSTGLDFFNGDQVPKNYEKAFALFQKAANLGHVESIFKLGSCFYLGLGVSKNLEQAAELFTQSGELGHVLGMINIGYCHLKAIGVSRYPEKMRFNKAFEWLKRPRN